MSPMAQGDIASNAFFLFLGFVVLVVAYFIGKKLKLLGDSVSGHKGLRRVFGSPAAVS